VSILPEEANSINLDNLAIFAGGVLVVGVIITVGFSALAINKFVNMKSNKIHLY
jgi:hypothetical protein